jgi:hypothetical protein
MHQYDTLVAIREVRDQLKVRNKLELQKQYVQLELLYHSADGPLSTQEYDTILTALNNLRDQIYRRRHD